MTDTYFIGEERDVEHIKEYEHAARMNEVMHASLAIFCTNMTATEFRSGDYKETFLGVLSVLLNVYCAMLQRYNRARVYNALERLAERETYLENESLKKHLTQ